MTLRIRFRPILLGSVIALLAISDAEAAKFSVIYAFQGNGDGAEPMSTLGRDANGNLYGTTLQGGANNEGTVFKLATDGTETVLYSFAGFEGYPNGELLVGRLGNLFGTTPAGGTESEGNLFELKSDGYIRDLCDFGSIDGISPSSNVIRDRFGNFYGTTVRDYGANGTFYEYKRDGIQYVLHVFQGPGDGAFPMGHLSRDQAGNFYGTTEAGGTDLNCDGGNGCGTVYRISSDGQETVLYSFLSTNDGNSPRGGVISDLSGNLYGTTSLGGAHNGGSVFKISTDGTEQILYSFGSAIGDGSYPEGSLLLDSSGNLYGTTYKGGGSICCNSGTAFKISPDGIETVLHTFTGGNDGGNPAGALIKGGDGYLYGTASTGGKFGYGTIFKVKE